MSLTRRSFGASLLALLASRRLLAAPASAPSTSAPSRARPNGPRKLLVIDCAGGMDTMYSVDPKQKADVETGIGPVFSSSELFSHGSLLLAPAWTDLRPYADRMQVLHAVQTSTAGHDTGDLQIRKMRRRLLSQDEPDFISVAGNALRTDHPFAAINFDVSIPADDVLQDPRTSKLSQLLEIANTPDLLDQTMRALRRPSSLVPESYAKSAVTMLERMRGQTGPKGYPRIPKEAWILGDRDHMAKTRFVTTMPWAKFVFEHDLAPVAFVVATAAWDSHASNDAWQRPLSLQLASTVRAFLDDLATVQRPRGHTLRDEVGIVIISELGRFPYVNSYGGKDHFPQVDAVLLGPGLQAGAFGQTGRELLPSEVSFSTGRLDGNGSIMSLDDLGRTLLEWIGHPAPEAHGYDGRVMDFCFA